MASAAPPCPSSPLPLQLPPAYPPIELHCAQLATGSGMLDAPHLVQHVTPNPPPPYTPVPLTHCALLAPGCPPPGTAHSPARPRWWATLAAAGNPVGGEREGVFREGITLAAAGRPVWWGGGCQACYRLRPRLCACMNSPLLVGGVHALNQGGRRGTRGADTGAVHVLCSRTRRLRRGGDTRRRSTGITQASGPMPVTGRWHAYPSGTSCMAHPGRLL